MARLIGRPGHVAQVLRLLRDHRVVEFKRADAPRLTPSMRSALDDLKLASLDVVYPGAETYRLADRVRVVPLSRILIEVRPL